VAVNIYLVKVDRFDLLVDFDCFDIWFQVWNRNIGRDELMGQFTIMSASQNYKKEEIQSFSMLGKGKKAQACMPGTVYVQIKHFRDLSEA
jgi:hypothetical protein